MTRPFTLRGWHVLAALLSFFGVVMAANAVFLTYAIRSFPGQEVEKSYLQGLHFNDRLEAKERQDALGWSATLTDARREDGRALIEIEFASKGGVALSGLVVEGELRRPASDDVDREVAFDPLGDGAYRAEAITIAPGAYDLSLTATSAAGETFTLEKRLLLP